MDGNTRLCTATAAAAMKESFGSDGQLDRSGWLRFLLGFAILYSILADLADLAEIDATDRYGLLIMVAVHAHWRG
jgi:hypothetical protein